MLYPAKKEHTMKNILIVSLLSIGFLVACSPVTVEKTPNKEPSSQSDEESSPVVGQVVLDSLKDLSNSNKESEKETVSEEPKVEVPVVEEPTKEVILDDTHSIKALKTCNDLVSTITKNQPKIEKPFGIQSTYQKLPNNESKVTVGFEAFDVKSKRVSYLGYCTFDSENNLLSFSADPIKE